MFSPEFRLLLLSCRLDDAGKGVVEARKIIGENQINWEDLHARADFHGIKPQVSDLLGKLPSHLVPPDIRNRFRDAVQDNLVRQLRHVAEFFQIREWLEKEGIAVIPYKGFFLGEAMYGNLADRESYDIDLFIDRHNLDKIKPMMTQKGYLLHETITELTDDYIFNELAEYNFDRYSGDTRISHVEFHWRSSMTFYRMDVGLEDLRSQIVDGRIQGRELQVFSPAANLLLVVMHHGGKECYLLLKQVLDIAHIIRRYPDLNTEWLFQEAERFHVSSLLFLGVRLASELTGVIVPPLFAEHINKRRIVSMAENRMRVDAKPVNELKDYKEKLASWFFRIRSRDGLEMKSHLCRYMLRKIVAPRMIPERWRHHFFNRKIRRSHAV